MGRTNKPLPIDQIAEQLDSSNLDSTTKLLVGQLLDHISSLQQTVDSLSVQVARTDQYSRRGTLVISGLPKAADETPESIIGVACKEIQNNTGIVVNASDIQIAHRNGDGKKNSDGNGAGTGRPHRSGLVSGGSDSTNSGHVPSITVRFHNLIKKDQVTTKIRNHGKNIKITQSLTPYLRGVKKAIGETVKTNRSHLTVRFIHLKSATAGLAVKLVSKAKPDDKNSWEHYTGIWCLQDFANQLK